MAAIGYHALRLLVFVLALACVIGGVAALNQTLSKRTEVQEKTFQLEGEPTGKSVLLVASYGENNASVPLERRGVQGVLRQEGVSMDIEYMDTRNYPLGFAASDSWKEMLRARISAHGPYDVIICADDDALHAIDAIHDELLPGVPVVFFSVNDVDYGSQVASKGYATGIIESGHVQQIMEAAARVEPEARNLVAITDDSALGQASLAQFETARSQLPGYTERVIVASSMTRSQLAEALQSLGPNDIVFQLAAYRDAEGRGYTLDATTRFVTANCPVPVFRESGAGVGQGITGASYVDYEGQGRRAAQMACQILEGANVADLPVESDQVTHPVFDVRNLEAHGLDPSLVPADAYLVNETSPWQAVMPFLLPTALLAAGIALVCYFVFLGSKKSNEDAQEIARSRDALSYQLRHDPLTDLPNRLALVEKGEEDSGKARSLVTMDLDDFSDINDSYGHDVGDQVIMVVADRLRQRMKDAFVARSSGDEFVLVLGHELKEGSPELLDLRKLVSEPIEAGRFTLTLTASAGVVNSMGDMTFEQMVQYGDLAMGEAKATRGRSSLSFFNEAMRDALDERIYLTTCLRRAIDEDGFTVVYQPQVDSATRRTVGVEALVRLRSGEFGPGQFIPVAEGAGLVVEIGRIVTQRVVEDLSLWVGQGRAPVPVSINFSAAQLKDGNYLDFLAGLLKDHGIDPRLVKIEITESLMLENAAAGEALCRRAHDMGIELALDDFGTGYSSLARMANLPMDYVKLDKSLVDEFLRPGREGFIDDVTHLVHSLGRTVIVEGVETEGQFLLCRKLGCDTIQGHYFSRPLSLEDLATFEPRTDPVQERGSEPEAGLEPAHESVPAMPPTSCDNGASHTMT